MRQTRRHRGGKYHNYGGGYYGTGGAVYVGGDGGGGWGGGDCGGDCGGEVFGGGGMVEVAAAEAADVKERRERK